MEQTRVQEEQKNVASIEQILFTRGPSETKITLQYIRNKILECVEQILNDCETNHTYKYNFKTYETLWHMKQNTSIR